MNKSFIDSSRILVFPAKDPNPYLANLQSAAIATGAQVSAPRSIVSLLHPTYWSSNRTIIYCWYENDTRIGSRISILGCLKVAAKFLFLRACSQQLILIRHNRWPHGMPRKQGELVKIFIDMCEVLATKRVVHGPYKSIFSAHDYLPHPRYNLNSDIFSVSENKRTSPDGIKNKKYGICIGTIEDHKDYTPLLESTLLDINILIAGECRDAEFENNLRQRLPSNRAIEIISRRLSDEELCACVLESAAVFVLQTDNSTIISGTIFYALSLKRPIVLFDLDLWNFLVSQHPLMNEVAFFATADSFPEVINTIDSWQVSEKTFTALEREFSGSHLTKFFLNSMRR